MNKLYLIIIFYSICGGCIGQIPDWEWAKSGINGSPIWGAGEGIDLVCDASGNIYVTGYFRDATISFGSITLYSQNPSEFNAYLVKYDALGKVLWAKKPHGPGKSFSYGITTDASANVYITGLFDSAYICFANDTLISNGTNIFLTKFDSSGNEIWAKSAQGTAVNALSNCVSLDPFGNIYITGFFGSTPLIFGNDTLANTGGYDLFVAKFDSVGNSLWAKTAIGSSQELSYSVTSDPAGNAYITGYFASPFIVFDTDTLFNSGQALSVYMIKYDPSGNILLAKNSIGGGGNYSKSVAVNSSGNIYITGDFNSYPIIFGPDSLFPSGNNGQDGYLVKYDSSGSVLWAKSFLGAETFKIVLDSNDNIYMTGNMGYPGMPINFGSQTLQLPPGSIDPMFIAKFDSSGNVLWAKALASGGDDHNGIALGPGGSIYVTSDFYSVNPFILGCDTLVLTGNEDIFVARLGHNLCADSSTTTNEYQQEENILLFPNPFTEKLYIRSNDYQLLTITIYDILSGKLFQQEFTNSVTLSTKQLVEGIYIYEIKNKNGVIKKGKIVKQ